MVIAQKRNRARKNRNRQTGHKNDSHQRRNRHANHVPNPILVLHVVAQDAPAQAGHEPDLLEQSRQARYISHESSSTLGRSAPPCPTMERKISSRVVVLPSALGTPARSSSSEPCATSFPLSMIATWLQRRSTISSTCDVKKMVTPRSVILASRAFNAPAASASTPSKGSSRKRIRGP